MESNQAKEWTPERLAKLSDKGFEKLLFETIARRSVILVGEIRVRHQSADSRTLPGMDLLFREAKRRGRTTHKDAETWVNSAKSGEGFLRNMLNPVPSREYELAVAKCLVRALAGRGWRFDRKDVGVRMKGVSSGVLFEVDLLLETDNPPERTIVEIKSQGSRVDVRVLESVAYRVVELQATRAIVVSRLGFERGAIAVAESRGIQLFTFDRKPRADVIAKWPDSRGSLAPDESFWVLQNSKGYAGIFGSEALHTQEAS